MLPAMFVEGFPDLRGARAARIQVASQALLFVASDVDPPDV
jgi:hypothetical protein